MGSNLHIQQHILRPQILGSAGRGWIIFFSTWSIELMGLVGWLGYAQVRNGWLQHKITLNYANDNNHISFKHLEGKKKKNYHIWEHKNELRQQNQLLPCQPQHSALNGVHNTNIHMHVPLLQTTHIPNKNPFSITKCIHNEASKRQRLSKQVVESSILQLGLFLL